MTTWILRSQNASKGFQGYLNSPSQDRQKNWTKILSLMGLAPIYQDDDCGHLDLGGQFISVFEGTSEDVGSFIMMLRANGLMSDIQVDSVKPLSSLNPIIEKAAQVATSYNVPWAELEKQRRLAEEAKDEIRSSIRYASQIQQAMLPNSYPSDLELGVHWQPLNIVGGDLYLVRDLGTEVLLAVIDCSGHGVPGSLLAVLTNSIFEQAIADPSIKEAGDYLSTAHQQLLRLLNRHDTKQVEGFDGTVCIYYRKERRLSVAGARNNLLIIEPDKSVTEVRVTRKSVGSSRLSEDFRFPTEQVDMEGRTFVMLTDGITDIMGGRGQKTLFGKERLKSELAQFSSQPVSKIISNLILVLKNYQGEEPTRDDQAMMVFRKA